jgi:hypothetical protein
LKKCFFFWITKRARDILAYPFRRLKIMPLNFELLTLSF